MMAGKRGVKRTRSYGLRARAWWLVRKNKETTLADLLMTLNDGSHKHADRNIGQYLTLLTRVGVLSRERVNDGKLTSNGVYRYRLVVDLGRKNPIMRKDGVYDPNSGQLLAWKPKHVLGVLIRPSHALDSIELQENNHVLA